MPIKTHKVYVVEKRLYTNAEGTELVDENRKYKDGEAGDHLKLFAVEGDEISIEKAAELGLVSKAEGKAEHKRQEES